MTMPWSAARESVCVCRGRDGGSRGGWMLQICLWPDKLFKLSLSAPTHTYTRGMQIDERVKERERESDWERQGERHARTILGAATPRFRFCVCFLVYLVAPLGLCFVLCSPSHTLSLSLSLSLTQHTRTYTGTRVLSVLQVRLEFGFGFGGNATVFSLWIFISRLQKLANSLKRQVHTYIKVTQNTHTYT